MLARAKARRDPQRRGCRRADRFLGCLVLKDEVPWLVEHDIDDHPLARSQDHRVDELLALDAAAIATNQLHTHARHGHVKHPGVGSVREVQPDHFALPGSQEH